MDEPEQDLRGPLVAGVGRLAEDLLIGRHGDPHIAFMVLVHPDRPPAVLVVSPGHSPYDMTNLRRGGSSEEGSPFPMAEFEEAVHAMTDAELGLMIGRHSEMQTGVVIGERVAEQWERRRMAPVERALQQATYESSHPAVCEKCKRRFTERGLPMHLARSWCGRDHVPEEQEQCRRCPEDRGRHPDGGACAGPGCPCPEFVGRQT